jgi:hypothetical protein
MAEGQVRERGTHQLRPVHAGVVAVTLTFDFVCVCAVCPDAHIHKTPKVSSSTTIARVQQGGVTEHI